MELNLCELSHAAGRVEKCPAERCPLWADDRCTIAGLRADLEGNAGLVEFLLELRSSLTPPEPRSVFRLFHPSGLA
jgi:hypothetical protein